MYSETMRDMQLTSYIWILPEHVELAQTIEIYIAMGLDSQ